MAVVTISRQLGSMGDLVATRAAERLGYEVVDKNLITEVARDANVPETEVERYDEQPVSAIRRFIRSLITPSRAVPVPPAMLWGLEFPYEVSAALLTDDAALGEDRHELDQTDYLRFLQAAVKRLWQRDNVVIVGRGAQAILKDAANVMHVRTIAPSPCRVRVVVERRGISEEEAWEMAQKSDRRRSTYLHANYGIDWDDASLYHFVVNTGRTSLEATAGLIEHAVANLESGPAHAEPPESHSG